ncbi:MAG: molybdopterin converting factor subunit 1 [Chloroflexi bacterium]|jgi:molybdopterin converting factor subunit 1|nr:molybdopterin converting factor subunit 1 [Chloroflexota bacterium]MBT7079888.1 molybdopterin converting factor subunit 1 [Chloroflexota bacterium]MBT7290129.1 molybdopterin converting factor subunit 1 [Chloroflexota bacterium]
MLVTVKFFASYREIVGKPAIEVELEDGATVAALIANLVEQYPDFPDDPSSAAVNAEYIDTDLTLSPGDEVAFFPPFSGG